MDLIATIRRNFRHLKWANDLSLKAVSAIADPPPRAVAIIGHMLGAESLWLRRIGASAPELTVWPTLSLIDAARLAPEIAACWDEVLESITPTDLDRVVEYVNSRGDRWHNKVGDILQHVPTHAAYHRGQLAQLVARAGHTPPLTDFIEAARQGYID
jgi:uncharacterized damage-inducible protein DinB